MISPRHSRSITTTRFSTRAGAWAPSRAYCSWSRCRSASSMSDGVVSSADHWAAASGSSGAVLDTLDPPPAVAARQDLVRLLGARRAGRVLRQRRVVLLPALEDRIDDPPLRL